MTTAEQTFPNDAKCLMCDDDGSLWREIYIGAICTKCLPEEKDRVLTFELILEMFHLKIEYFKKCDEKIFSLFKELLSKQVKGLPHGFRVGVFPKKFILQIIPKEGPGVLKTIYYNPQTYKLKY
jgi:hypothetical protein